MGRYGATANSFVVPAPVKGWSSLESLADAGELTAIVMDNVFPRSDSIEVRHGCTLQSSGVSGGCVSLNSYNGPSGTTKILSASASTIYDSTSVGSAATSLMSGFSGGDWVGEMFTPGSGVPYLVLCNGVDGVLEFDGTTLSDVTASITGTSGAVSRFAQACSHKTRLWFLEGDSTNLWYLPVSSITGAASKFPLGSVFKRGGKIKAIATWSSSEGYVLDDMLVIISDQGEVLVYAGTDPSSSSTWALKMRFELAPPLSNRCFISVGAELFVGTEAGVLPISHVIEVDPSALSGKAITRNIRRAFTDAVASSRGLSGWCMAMLPNDNMAIINVPGTGSVATQQFAMNTMTGAWARFTGWNATCWVYSNGGIYFGTSDGGVFRANYGSNDNGSPIGWTVVPAFSHLGKRGLMKMVNLVQPVTYSDIDQTVSMAIAADYNIPSASPVSLEVTGDWFTWDVSVWDGGDRWRGAEFRQKWSGSGNIGRMISCAMTANTDAGSSLNSWSYRIISFEFVFETGAIV